jgi:hypothetical protein
MIRTARRSRVRCKLRCQIIRGRRHVEGTVISLSEGGLGIVAPLQLDECDPIELRILPPGRTRDIEISGLVWYERPARIAQPRAPLRMLGCVVSDLSGSLSALMTKLDPGSTAPVARRQAPVREQKAIDRASKEALDLPRSREPLPPPKPDPEETLPRFKVRMKQVAGPRTRIVALRAQSVAEAARIARSQIDTSSDGSPAWELLEVKLAD